MTTGPERVRNAIKIDRGQHAPALPVTLCASMKKPRAWTVYRTCDSLGWRPRVKIEFKRSVAAVAMFGWAVSVRWKR